MRLFRRSRLLSFAHDVKRAGAFAQRRPRLQTVEVAGIVGSVGRASTLGVDFRPPMWSRWTADEARFERIRGARAAGESLPPIELHKLGRSYYVVDGHHRVAAGAATWPAGHRRDVVELVPARRSA
jgi:hypothetical protein